MTDWANDLKLPLEQIKGDVEVAADPPLVTYHQEFISSSSWVSGVVLDSSTAMQMAEFQEVVDKLSRGGAPPPYQQQQQQQQGAESHREEMVLPHAYLGHQRGVDDRLHGGPAGPRSLPLAQDAARIKKD